MADSILGLDLSRNMSLFTVPAAFVLCMIPNVWAAALASGAYDLANPRAMVATAKADTRLDKPTQQKITRAKAASDNGFETLGYYAAAVVAANVAGVAPRTLNLLSGAYVLSRALFVLAYVQLGADRRLAPVRSACWTLGSILTMALYIKAGLRSM
ncbi:hypothetical protein ESCO_000743 [Escovopsis weberi]|uniref:MAPEG family protein n=1 Tax=Escovopsis weberi TaxID=150374 RepID=A0A0N0RTE4_ESCWE|nr:hypothetical protein ESCO_000743 [Escovopsis weberi]